MRLICRGLVALIALMTILAGLATLWLCLYTADLPQTSELEQFDPSNEADTQMYSCDGTVQMVHAVPPSRLGRYTVDALKAAEGNPDTRGPFRALSEDVLAGGMSEKRHLVGQYSVRLARDFVCDERRTLRRALKELRVANQIHRRFTTQQILTIYLNRVYFGENAFGVEAASARYFGKHASDLSLDEAAMVAGLIRRPNFDSPMTHPDRALQRRNSVLDQMVRQGMVGRDEADRAKSTPLKLKAGPLR